MEMGSKCSTHSDLTSLPSSLQSIRLDTLHLLPLPCSNNKRLSMNARIPIDMHAHHDLDHIPILQDRYILVRRHRRKVGDDVVQRERGGKGDSLGDRGFFGGVDGRGLLDDQGVSPARSSCRRVSDGDKGHIQVDIDTLSAFPDPDNPENLALHLHLHLETPGTHSLQRSSTDLPSTTVGMNFFKTSPRIAEAV
jgi:hypothetical protein